MIPELQMVGCASGMFLSVLWWQQATLYGKLWTEQSRHEMQNSNKECSGCAYYKPTSLFELCKHPDSDYKDQFQRVQLHTIGFMRTRGNCGVEARQFKAA